MCETWNHYNHFVGIVCRVCPFPRFYPHDVDALVNNTLFMLMLNSEIYLSYFFQTKSSSWWNFHYCHVSECWKTYLTKFTFWKVEFQIVLHPLHFILSKHKATGDRKSLFLSVINVPWYRHKECMYWASHLCWNFIFSSRWITEALAISSKYFKAQQLFYSTHLTIEHMLHNFFNRPLSCHSF